MKQITKCYTFLCANPIKEMITPFSTLPDAGLLDLMKDNNSDAFEVIFERYWKRLYSYAYRIYADEEICEDIVQEVFISLWEKAADSHILNLEGYLLRAVKYKIANHLRDLKFSQAHTDVLQNIPSPSKTEKALEYQEFENKVFSEIEKLPPRSREVFMLSRFEHLSNTEIAEKLNISIRTVETHISAALKHLKSQLDIFQFSLIVIGMFL